MRFDGLQTAFRYRFDTEIRKYEVVASGLWFRKINCVNAFNTQNSDNTKNAAEQGNAEERPDAGCGIKR